MSPLDPCFSSRNRLGLATVCGLTIWCVLAGCRPLPVEFFQPFANPIPPVEVPVSNPSHIGLLDPDFLWRQIVDALDDYFLIDTEEPVRRTTESWQDGRVVTYPRISGTILEPWRGDAARGFERLQSTFQTIRRTATVRVTCEPSGYQIDITVLKEQEDVDQSQFATAGASAQRHDGTIVRNENQLRQLPVTLGWFEIGRDRELETRLMASILGRVTNVEPPKARLLHH
ncbi:MAG: hypothetical protein KDB22_28660 [Planctomycetales bacterium]|nr:hypothetical protein [Planctomycetales bacterium]